MTGHVDHGKSTLIGRLLHDTGSVPEGRYDQLTDMARRRGTSFEIAALADALRTERDQNITIETTEIVVRTPRRHHVLIDAPGHQAFLRNMVTGASRADAALVVIDVTQGIQEQSRRHGSLLRLLGLVQIAVVVNKLDLVGFSAPAFHAVVAEYAAFLAEIGLPPPVAVPAAARSGDNVATPSDRLSWHAGGTVLDVLESFAAPPPAVAGPLRLPVQDVYRFDDRRIVAGRVESGTLRRGDRVVFVPSGAQAIIATIERWNARPEDVALAGESIGVTLVDDVAVDRGEIAARVETAPASTVAFRSRVFWLAETPLRLGQRYRIRLGTADVEADVIGLADVVDAATLAAEGDTARTIAMNCVGDATFGTTSPVAVDRFDAVAATGRFAILDDGVVAGGGIVLAEHAGEPDRRRGHHGAVVWFTGLPASGKSTLATALERRLSTAGWHAFVLDGDHLRLGLNADLGFSVADRSENIRRVAEVARLFAGAGVIAITALISPAAADRARAREIVQRDAATPFLEVHVSTPLVACEARDPKGLYAKARAGEVREFTGVSAPYEPPAAPALSIDTAVEPIDAAVDRLVAQVLLLRHRAHS